MKVEDRRGNLDVETVTVKTVFYPLSVYTLIFTGRQLEPSNPSIAVHRLVCTIIIYVDRVYQVTHTANLQSQAIQDACIPAHII